MTFLLRRRAGRRDGSMDRTNHKFDDAPPPYKDRPIDKNPGRDADQDKSPVQRLRGFITQHLVLEYDLASKSTVNNHNDNAGHSYYLDLCRKYCLLLGAQLDSRDEIVATKQELMSVIFEPARMLDIPAEMMEYFLLSTRIFSKGLLEKNCFDDKKVFRHSEEILLRLAIDYTIIIDALAVQESNPLWPASSTCHPSKAGLCRKLKDKCLALHQRYYPWMLDLRLINLEQVIKEQKENEKNKHAAGVLVHHENDTIHDQNYHNNINSTLGSLPQTSARAVSEYHLIGMTFESKWNHPTTISFSTDFPSFLLPYRLHTSWPLTTALSYQASRPCSALSSPHMSHNLRIRFSDFHLWLLKQRQHPNTCFQPFVSKIFSQKGFECGLPNKLNVGDMSFTNPDGGAPKSVIENGVFKDQWEWKYITGRLEEKRSIASAMLERPMLAESTNQSLDDDSTSHIRDRLQANPRGLCTCLTQGTLSELPPVCDTSGNSRSSSPVLLSTSLSDRIFEMDPALDSTIDTAPSQQQRPQTWLSESLEALVFAFWIFVYMCSAGFGWCKVFARVKQNKCDSKQT